MALAGVEGPVGGDAGNLLVGRDLVEQLGQHGRIADVTCSELGRPDLQGFLINSDVDLAPDAPLRAAMLAGAPLAFAFALGLDARAVDQEVQRALRSTVDDIYRYTRDRWGAEQADRSITGIFAAFDRIASHGVASKPVPAEFGVDGFFFRCEHHFVYWRKLSNGDIGIVTTLHERMHQIDRFREDFGVGSDRA